MKVIYNLKVLADWKLMRMQMLEYKNSSVRK